eukprot:TRINITY_DN14061_c0_g1_i1.p4 TRINITY_DN14061_c0_g1~~TRINITY_DN14061_c0_g1_i1.p4  ORF type:complete len:107 (-),score=39.60 TRINITY_DN14061_c0_g1_i1:621-941(-)
MRRRPPRSTQGVSSAASDVYKRQVSTQSTWEMIVEKLKSVDKKVILLLNKADEVKVKEDILKAIAVWKEKLDFEDIIPVSAVKGDNLDRLIPLIEQKLPFFSSILS